MLAHQRIRIAELPNQLIIPVLPLNPATKTPIIIGIIGHFTGSEDGTVFQQIYRMARFIIAGPLIDHTTTIVDQIRFFVRGE